MSTKGTQFSRTMRYFREADIDEASAALAAAADIVADREKQSRPAPKQRRTRRAKTNAADAGSQETLANA